MHTANGFSLNRDKASMNQCRFGLDIHIQIEDSMIYKKQQSAQIQATH